MSLSLYKQNISKIQEESMASPREINFRINLLRKFNYLTEELALALKGRVLAIIDNPYNLVISECIFEGIFTNLTIEELAAVASVFVCEDRTKVEGKDWNLVSPNLDFTIKRIEALVANIAQNEETLKVKTEMAEDGVKLSMVEVVYMWAQGKPFIEICTITSIKEGNIVRGILRVHDILTTLICAAEITGDNELKEKATTASVSIQRDIAFAASLYITD